MIIRRDNNILDMTDSMKILIVEDDPLIQRMYARALMQAGLQTSLIDNGAAALDTALQTQPDLVLMDVMMPDINGIEALKILKADNRTKSIPVIMLSANDDPELMQEALEAGASRYLAKSVVEPDQIVSAIQQSFSK